MKYILGLLALLLLVLPISGQSIYSSDIQTSAVANSADITSINTATLTGTDVSLTQSVGQTAIGDGDMNLYASNSANILASNDASLNQGVVQNAAGNDVTENSANWGTVNAGGDATTSQSLTQSGVGTGTVDQTAGNIVQSSAGSNAYIGQLVQSGAQGNLVDQNVLNLAWGIAPTGEIGQTTIIGAVSATDAFQSSDNIIASCQMDNAMVGQGAFVAGNAGNTLIQDASNTAFLFGDNPTLGQFIAGSAISGNVADQYLSNNAVFAGDGGALAQHIEEVAFAPQVTQIVNNNWI